MDYTLTRIDPNGENDRYPLQNKRLSVTRLSSTFTAACIWGNSNMHYTIWLTGAVKLPVAV